MKTTELLLTVVTLRAFGNKGDQNLKAAESSQLDFTRSLQGIFQSQYGKSTQTLDLLSSVLKNQLDNPTGYSTSALAALRTGATENTARSYAQASQALHEQQAARGGSQLPSGVNAQLEAQNANAGAALNAQSQNQITLEDEDLRQQNYWRAVSGLGSVAEGYNPLGYAGAGNQAAGSIAGLGEAFHQSQQGFFSHLADSFAGGFGTALGGGIGGGFGSILSGTNKQKQPCYIAAAIFGGWFAPETVLIRSYLMNEVSRTWIGRTIVGAYAHCGEWIANQPRLVRLLTPLFNRILRKAQESQ